MYAYYRTWLPQMKVTDENFLLHLPGFDFWKIFWPIYSWNEPNYSEFSTHEENSLRTFEHVFGKYNVSATSLSFEGLRKIQIHVMSFCIHRA